MCRHGGFAMQILSATACKSAWQPTRQRSWSAAVATHYAAIQDVTAGCRKEYGRAGHADSAHPGRTKLRAIVINFARPKLIHCCKEPRAMVVAHAKAVVHVRAASKGSSRCKEGLCVACDGCAQTCGELRRASKHTSLVCSCLQIASAHDTTFKNTCQLHNMIEQCVSWPSNVR